MTHQELAASALYLPASLLHKGDIRPCRQIIGQDRALEALNFALQFQSPQAHVFCLGPKGVGRTSLTLDIVRQFAAQQTSPCDWVYVANFDDMDHPKALSLPTGQAVLLSRQMTQVVQKIHLAIQHMLADEHYRLCINQIENDCQNKKQQWMDEIQTKLATLHATFVKTQSGFGISPIYQNKTLTADQFNVLPLKVRQKLMPQLEKAHQVLSHYFQNPPDLDQLIQKQKNDLNTGYVQKLLDDCFDKIVSLAQSHENIQEFVRQCKVYLLTHIDTLLGENHMPLLEQLYVNPFVVNHTKSGLPVVHLDHPTLSALLGKIERRQESGSLLTNHCLIQAGALHLANGGFLVLEAKDILTMPGVWAVLKRSLFSHQIHMESPTDENSLFGLKNIIPQDIPLSVKVILIGDMDLYATLLHQDEDFSQLFKLQVRFADKMQRHAKSEKAYAGVLLDYIRQNHLCSFSISALNGLLEWSSRIAQDQKSLSTYFVHIHDLMREADFCAKSMGMDVVTDKILMQAILRREYRLQMGQFDYLQALEKRVIQLSVSGQSVGQINALVVCEQGSFAFGRPSRVSCRIHAGSGVITDIEREVSLGGNLHTKGLLILASYLSATFGLKQPLPIDAVIAWEQSYQALDGDSASSAELYALMSAIGNIPMNQGIAATGSVNQLGEVQAVGGLNEKIEGYFDVCQHLGLTGHQGVIIPKVSVATLMLNQRVRLAVQKHQFHIWPIEHIDEGFSILTGLSQRENYQKIRHHLERLVSSKADLK